MDALMISITAIFISLIVVAIGVNMMFSIRKLLNNGQEVEGVIFDIEQSTDSSFTMSRPIVRFMTDDQKWHTKTSSIWAIPGIYKKGEIITLVYLKNSPSNFVIKDRSTYLVPYLLLFIGVVSFLFSIKYLIDI